MYKLAKHSITRLTDNASIPFAADNSDYIEYQEWLAAGNTPQPEDPIPQAVLDALANAAAEKAIAAMLPEAVETLMAWAEKQASGPDKVALQTLMGKINTEKAKKK